MIRKFSSDPCLKIWRTSFLTGLCLFGLSVSANANSYSQEIEDNWVLGFKDMTAQWIGEMVHMTGAIGGFIDGSVTNEYQLTMQKLQANALRDYTPGENLCRFGTLSRSLAVSQYNATSTGIALQTMMLDRETSNGYRARLYAEQDDLARRNTLAELYCNPADNDKTPAACNCDIKAGTCDSSSGPLSQRSNRDLDFARLFDSRLTLKINFTDGELTPDEQDVLAFLNNLSGYKTFPAISPDALKSGSSSTAIKTYLDMRSLIASRGVVRNALAQQIAQKTPGGDGVSSFALNILKELGMSEKEAKHYLETEGVTLTRDGSDTAEDINPSYYAQMEILTKKIYQNPNFYVNLVDKPANVERTRAALTAVSLMQRRDMKEMLDRRELLLSQLLEFSIRTEEETVRKRIRQAVAIGN